MTIRAPMTLGALMLALMFVAVDCQAQFGGRPGSGGVFGGGRTGRDHNGGQDQRGGRPQQPQADSYEQIEYRLSLLEEDLHLKDAQRAAWDSFAARVRAYAGDIARARARAAAASAANEIDGVRYLEHAADAARNRATAIDDIAVAAKSLYSGLSPEQEKLADLRIPTIVATQPRGGGPRAEAGPDLPDLGSDRPARR